MIIQLDNNTTFAKRLFHLYTHAKTLYDKSKDQNVFAKLYDGQTTSGYLGKNSYIKTHPFQKECATITNNPRKEYLHAEIACILNAKKRINKINTIAVVRLNKQLIPVLSKPCPVCQYAIFNHTNIINILYYNNEKQPCLLIRSDD